jgi:hypothetical protein
MKISPLDYNYIRTYGLDGHTTPVTVVSKDADFTLDDGIQFLRGWLATHEIKELDKMGWILRYDASVRLV